MSEQEKIDIIRVIREELQAHRDYADIKYATNESLNNAKIARDNSCDIHKQSFTTCVGLINEKLAKIDKQLIYMMFGILIVGAIAGIDNVIPMILRALGL
jgi:hypothetical protein